MRSTPAQGLRTRESKPTSHTDTEAERVCLGTALLSSDGLEQMLALLTADDFALARHRTVYRGILRLHESGQPVDAVLLRGSLDQHGDLEAAGGVVYLADLVAGVPRRISVEGWAARLREHTRTRALRAQLVRLQARLDEGEDADTVLPDVERLAIPGSVSGGVLDRAALAKRTWAQIDAEVTGHASGIPTGLRGLDDRLRFRGWRPGQLVYVGARTSRGKSALLVTTFAEAAAAAGHRVLVMSREMSAEDVQVRRLVAAANVSMRDLFAWRGADRDKALSRLVAAADTLTRPIDYTAPGVRTLAALRAECYRAKAQGELGLVIVDYLGLVAPPPGRDSAKSLYERTTTTSQGLKALAMDIDVPVLCAVQLNRGAAGGTQGGTARRVSPRPTLADFRDSGAIEQDCDAALLIHQSSTRDAIEHGPAELILAKQRNGWTGPIDVEWDSSVARFRERELVSPPSEWT